MERGGVTILDGETRKALSGDLNEQRENMDLPPPPNSERPTSVLWPKIFMSFNSQLECHISQKAFCGSPYLATAPSVDILITPRNNRLFTLLGHCKHSADRSCGLTQCLVHQDAQAGLDEGMHE